MALFEYLDYGKILPRAENFCSVQIKLRCNYPCDRFQLVFNQSKIVNSSTTIFTLESHAGRSTNFSRRELEDWSESKLSGTTSSTWWLCICNISVFFAAPADCCFWCWYIFGGDVHFSTVYSCSFAVKKDVMWHTTKLNCFLVNRSFRIMYICNPALSVSFALSLAGYLWSTYFVWIDSVPRLQKIVYVGLHLKNEWRNLIVIIGTYKKSQFTLLEMLS